MWFPPTFAYTADMAREPQNTKPGPRAATDDDGASDLDAVAEAIFAACAAGPGKSIDPAIVARALGGSPSDVVPWRVLIRRIRAAAAALQDRGRIAVLRKGKPVHIRAARGVIRLALPTDTNG